MESECLEGNWLRVQAACAGREHLFIVQDTILYRLPRIGAAEPLSDRWHPRAMTAFGDALFAVENGDRLYRASQIDGSYEGLTSGWREVKAIAATRDGLYIANDRNIYQIDPKTGAETALPNRWDVKLMIGFGMYLFVVEVDGTLRRIDPREGTYHTLPGNYPLTTAIAATQDAVWAVDDTVLYRVDPRTGAYARIANRFLTERLVALGPALYSFERGGIWRVVPTQAGDATSG